MVYRSLSCLSLKSSGLLKGAARQLTDSSRRIFPSAVLLALSECLINVPDILASASHRVRVARETCDFPGNRRILFEGWRSISPK